MKWRNRIIEEDVDGLGSSLDFILLTANEMERWLYQEIGRDVGLGYIVVVKFV